MSFWGSLLTISPLVAKQVAEAVSIIGPAVRDFATRVGTFIANSIDKMPALMEKVGTFANRILTLLGILNPGERVDDLGERAMQAAEKGIRITNFDDMDAYLEELRQFKLDPKVTEKRNPTERLIAGVGLGTVAMERKFNVEPGSLEGVWLIPILNSHFFTPERIASLIASGRFGPEFIAHLESRLSLQESEALRSRLAVDEGGQSPAPDHYVELREDLARLRDDYEALKVKLNENVQRGTP
ncbi:hypothetical protein LRB11_13225 [Ectothiorhodospira haloalkaliphila]|uniref:hypothetical protein n=1 Tax=Ectothiorhodospira haloalkaliphila TaxID=421628 RepID=UPI001EE90BC6|nr:hypothetical protein [Ectothiorhodospira haloalkaliphila]MCG5525883.1 hypothetical protein [Ectothiorhodospira haloalkaliphila]